MQKVTVDLGVLAQWVIDGSGYNGPYQEKQVTDEGDTASALRIHLALYGVMISGQ